MIKTKIPSSYSIKLYNISPIIIWFCLKSHIGWPQEIKMSEITWVISWVTTWVGILTVTCCARKMYLFSNRSTAMMWLPNPSDFTRNSNYCTYRLFQSGQPAPTAKDFWRIYLGWVESDIFHVEYRLNEWP